MELKQLYEQGILTKEEMEAEKQKILGQPHSDNTKSEGAILQVSRLCDGISKRSQQ